MAGFFAALAFQEVMFPLAEELQLPLSHCAKNRRAGGRNTTVVGRLW